MEMLLSIMGRNINMDITFKPKELKPIRDRQNANAIFLDKEFERKVLLHIITNSLKKICLLVFLP